MPLHARHRTLTPLAPNLGLLLAPAARAFPTHNQLIEHLARLPIPDAKIARRVAADDKLPVRADVHVDGIPGTVVTPKGLLPILPKSVRGRVHDDLVVPALEGAVLAARVRGRAHHGVHVRLRDELDRHGDAVLPRAQALVVRGGDEAARVVDEGDGVDGTQVVVVLLRHLPRARVELHDLLVRHARQELVPVFGGRVEGDAVRRLARGEARDALPLLRVPELHLTVEGGGEEGRAVGGEGAVGDGLAVACVGAQ